MEVTFTTTQKFMNFAEHANGCHPSFEKPRESWSFDLLQFLATPDELGRAAVFRWEQGGTDWLVQTWIVEPDAQIILGGFPARSRLPRIADARFADHHTEGRCVAVRAIVVRSQAPAKV
jgi:hypothetical protein